MGSRRSGRMPYQGRMDWRWCSTAYVQIAGHLLKRNAHHYWSFPDFDADREQRTATRSKDTDIIQR